MVFIISAALKSSHTTRTSKARNPAINHHPTWANTRAEPAIAIMQVNTPVTLKNSWNTFS
ncbi:hypothetical protein D3C72_2600370 [compost metagenome]